MSNHQNPWEPDHRKLGNWTEMFEQQRHGGALPEQAPAPPAAYDDAQMPEIDPVEYRPWILQRGHRGMMLALRWFDTKAGLWHGSAVAYHSLYAVDLIGDRMLSLDFGVRQFVLEGSGLDVLGQYLLAGSVLKIIQYAQPIWPTHADGPVVTAIRKIVAEP
jgi:hypothetical protein